MEEDDNTLRMDWDGQVVEHHQIIMERVIEMNHDDGVVDEEEEYLVGEEIIPSTDVTLTNSLDHIAAENLIYMAHDGHVQSMGDLIEEQVEQVENADYNEQQQFYECQEVTEEVVCSEDWIQQGEERVEILADQLNTNNDNLIEEDLNVPLPTDQDEYTSLRPYPCDFCSRRFRKKASLMNHMVAHQNDRPHVCNLCGARYIRRCDLLNHLKIHAYSPEEGEDASDDEEIEMPAPSIPRPKKQSVAAVNKRGKSTGAGSKGSLKKKIKLETEDLSPVYSYVTDMQNYSLPAKLVERYPVTDPRKPFVCQHCGVGFAREKALQSHQKVR